MEENVDEMYEDVDEDLNGLLHERLVELREMLNGRFLHMVVISRDGNMLVCATGDPDESDETFGKAASALGIAAGAAYAAFPAKIFN